MSRHTQEKAWSDFRVGLITFAGVFLIVLGVIFAGGDKGLLFRKTALLKAHLTDVGGLKKGSSVTIAGMTVGRVTDVAFVKGKKSNQVEVTMEIRSDVRPLVKVDSVPSVRTQGMLGDRYIDLSVGKAESPSLAEGGILVGDNASDFDKTLRQASEVLRETEKLLSAINEQQGSAGQFVYDQELYKNLTAISKELEDLIKDFKKHPRKYVKFSLF